MCVCMPVCMYARMCICIYVCICMHVCVFALCMCLSVCLHVLYACMYICTCAFVYEYIYGSQKSILDVLFNTGHLILNYIYLLIHFIVCMYGNQRMTCVSQFSSSATWIPGIESKRSSLGTGIFTHRVILPAF